MQKILRFLILLVCFTFTVSCCFSKVPSLKGNGVKNYIGMDVPINPKSIVFIISKDMEFGHEISGSAIIIASDKKESWGVSAGHVCYPEPNDPTVARIEAWLPLGVDTEGNMAPIEILAIDTQKDTCIFKFGIGNLSPVKLAKKMPLVGEKVYLGAYPLGVYQPGHTPFFDGYYAGILGGAHSFTIPVAPGSSGGGIINQRGELVGIVSMAIDGFENITLTAGIEDISSLLLVAKENSDRLSIIR